jgi:hypothetical protein
MLQKRLRKLGIWSIHRAARGQCYRSDCADSASGAFTARRAVNVT